MAWYMYIASVASVVQYVLLCNGCGPPSTFYMEMCWWEGYPHLHCPLPSICYHSFPPQNTTWRLLENMAPYVRPFSSSYTQWMQFPSHTHLDSLETLPRNCLSTSLLLEATYFSSLNCWSIKAGYQPSISDAYWSLYTPPSALSPLQ